MPSPFPGMDPYLEAPGPWPDFHGAYIYTIRVALNSLLPKGYIARAERYVWIHEPDAAMRELFGRPDAYIAESGEPPSHATRQSTITAPETVALPVVRREGERFIKILDLDCNRVITVIELLSPSNKNPGDDRDLYLFKRNEYLNSGVNLVEIDLLRRGTRLPIGKPMPPHASYYVLVCRASEVPAAGVWWVSIRDELPTIAIPLSQDIDDVILALQPPFKRAFDECQFELGIDYSKPPIPPLAEADAFWAADLIAKRIK